MEADLLDEYKDILSRYGYDENDFELTEKDETDYTQDPYFTVGKVSIRCKSTDITKTYNTGHSSIWPTDFEDDLRVGYFKDTFKA
ncbi:MULTISPECIES: hypothetical protein [Legionella]|uniref:Uncharacterized protein n=1 Tax=Legionella resiliens TaxID=2905958 RepID=A0ABS8WZM9_9GAMM|nr:MULTISPECIES: hypothetical protein [unclassified Legionella]MCE0721827.1 hypothetical protein [Legionella sp. 9fVS26]MCE3530981.1 hypothetical protein [Legionella sp. 8cVS16]QLZ70544.1 hypothetical protein FOLKNPGA_03358 [Legionella sp. PC1000]